MYIMYKNICSHIYVAKQQHDDVRRFPSRKNPLSPARPPGSTTRTRGLETCRTVGRETTCSRDVFGINERFLAMIIDHHHVWRL